MTDPRRTLWLALVLVLVLVLDVGVWASAQRAEAPLPDWSGFATEVPDTVVVTRSEVVTRLTRNGETWRVEAPYADKADADAVEALLASVGSAALLEARVDDDPETHGTYGLDGLDPIRVEVLAAERRLAELYVGFDGPGRTTFVRLPGADDVYRSRLGGRALADRSPGAWRDPTILDRDPADVLGVRFDQPAGSVSLVRSAGLGGGSGWTMQGRPDLPLDEASIDAVVDAFAHLSALEVLPSAPTELAEPALVVSILFADGTETLGFVALRGQAFGLREADGRAFRVRSELLAAVSRPADAWRDRTLLRLDPSALTQLTLREPDRETTLERVDGAWTVSRPVGIDVDTEHAGRAARFLAAVEVEGWAVVPPEEAGFPSATRIVIRGQGEHVLELGERVPGRPPGREALFVRLASDPERIGALPVRTWTSLRRAWAR